MFKSEYSLNIFRRCIYCSIRYNSKFILKFLLGNLELKNIRKFSNMKRIDIKILFLPIMKKISKTMSFLTSSHFLIKSTLPQTLVYGVLPIHEQGFINDTVKDTVLSHKTLTHTQWIGVCIKNAWVKIEHCSQWKNCHCDIFKNKKLNSFENSSCWHSLYYYFSFFLMKLYLISEILSL